MGSNLRQNPFTRSFSWKQITGESSTVALFPHLPETYGVILKEIPRQDSVVLHFDSGGAYIPESALRITIVNDPPNQGQARVDYQRGHVLFNLADNGNRISINYEGGGTILSMENLKELIQEVGDARYARLT